MVVQEQTRRAPARRHDPTTLRAIVYSCGPRHFSYGSLASKIDPAPHQLSQPLLGALDASLQILRLAIDMDQLTGRQPEMAGDARAGQKNGALAAPGQPEAASGLDRASDIAGSEDDD